MLIAPAGERRELLRAIALTSTPEAFGPLRDVFVSDDTFARENRDYAAYLMNNCRGAEDRVLALLRELPREDYMRRAMMMGTASSIAADREDPAISAKVYGYLREVLADRTEIPQIRLSALERLRRDLRLEDMKTIKGWLADEEEPMRKALTAFLFEFF
jgi:hypothetical protein